ncbi:hypothetical protein PsorP6_000900 [Peronosclerospora sorghi]|uniref:Uncharacterized protein n=1 Tax=Peronosclerospora sorghi TaxID=230839 RepID=A0ACC0WQ46_9STRA|nr:hypothetical protein PsorP6_000900 [Peronosclerospora sorghi]
MKRSREDVGVSKEEYEASLTAPDPSNASDGIPQAPPNILQARTLLTVPPTSRRHQASRHLMALNRVFVATVQRQWEDNKNGPWNLNMKEYLWYAREIDATFGDESGHVLTFGSGECGQLGHGVDEQDLMVPYPRVVSALQGLSICRVACGGLHSVAIAVTGQVYTWGCNDDGALGRDGDENLPATVPGFGPQDAIAVQVGAGDCHTVVVTLSGTVYTWGCYRDKEGKQWCDATSAQAAFKQKQVQPFRMPTLEHVADVRCGSAFNLARTKDGRVYSWGLGEMGELGRNVDVALKDAMGEYKVDMVYTDHLHPALVMVGNEPLPFVKAIGCGAYHILVVSSASGYLYTCGLNNYGQLGLGHTDNCTHLQLVDDLSTTNVASADGGAHHSVVLTLEGDVYTFGRADSGQLGVLDTCATGEFKDRPQKVVMLSSSPSGNPSPVVQVVSGSNHVLALTENKAIYSWGYGDMLALGNGTERDETKPHALAWSKATCSDGSTVGKAHILQLAAGGQHSVILAKLSDKL